MREPLWVVFLCILCLQIFGRIGGNRDEDFMVLAGPLPKHLSSGPEGHDMLECVIPNVPLKEYFKYIQSKGVTHVKVPLSWTQLLPTGQPSQPQQDVVKCYQTLMRQLLKVGLQPLVILHGSAVPNSLKSVYGEWENQELVDMFQKYAEFAIREFGDLAHSWITFSDLREIWNGGQDNDAIRRQQNILQLHRNIHQISHQRFPDSVSPGRGLSFGLEARNMDALSYIKALANVDFLSLHIDYDCASSKAFAEQLRNLQKSYKSLPILIYKMSVHDCVHGRLQPRKHLLHDLQINGLNIIGYEMIDEKEDVLLLRDKEDPPTGHQPLGMMPGSMKSYQTVWDKFGAQTSADRDAFLQDSFPSGFQWATSQESFKVEGGWSEGGKGETIWDRFGHDGLAFDNQTADLACDSYNKIEYDVYLLRGLQVNTYQFSISWARIFPSGHKDSLAEAGVAYYDKLINTLIDSGIQPAATLYHWDLPQALQDAGGWTNPSIVDAFKNYADFCFSRFGNRVKTWNTFSSPWVVSHAGHGTGEHPPSLKDYTTSSYQVTHNILKSHAEAWHIYNDNYRSSQGGKVGIALNSDWAQPKDPSNAEQIAAADRYLQSMLGWFAHPIFVNGDYSQALKAQIEKKKNECPNSVPAILPTFTTAEMSRIKGTADFFGLNHYTSRLVNSINGGCNPGPEGVGDFEAEVDPTWPTSASDWIVSVPWGLRRLLYYISVEYLSVTKVPVYITGNGMPTEYAGDTINDVTRVEYLTRYINEALKAKVTDGVDVQRFTVQSFLDGFEGPEGYSQRFGLQHVNFEDANRPRTPKQSAYFFSQVIEQNGFGTPTQSSRRVPNILVSPHPRNLAASEVPSQAKVVWETLSWQTKFQRHVYHYGTFPQDFIWGVSSSAYQIEGGWNADGKGESIWDRYTHGVTTIPESANGDVACDSYKRLDEDLYMLRALKVKSYRFSLSWSRIFPNGRNTSVNPIGVDYYNRLINGLLANGITPMVTLYYWDLPQALQDNGGWESVEMINIFNEFADFCFATFGDRVKFWITFNQPHTIAWLGYGTGQVPPNVNSPGSAPYEVAHNLIKAHATAYRTYDEKYRASQNGLVTIALDADWVEPIDPSVHREILAADRALQFRLGWFAHPIFKNGDYPEAMKQQVAVKSELQGLPESRLPAFTEEEKALIRGTADVFCINHYTTKKVNYVTDPLTPHSYQYDRDIAEHEESDSPTTAIDGQRAVAWGLRRLLKWIKEEYGNPDVYISENGMATDSGMTWDDIDRVFYYKTYIDEALKAIEQDGVKVKGYMATSLLDSFEWLNGYRVGFGLHHVDFQNPQRPRTPKYSAHYYYQVIKDNGLPIPEEEEMLWDHFREDFLWSSSTSAYQIEGAWRADGKGLSIWDKFSHTPGNIANNDNGDISCDSYNKLDTDIGLLKQIRVSHYRFSISWPRVLPDGTVNNINEAGLAYYQRVIDALLAANIQPQITLYHWDLPQALEEEGGWLNETIVAKFRDYADLLFSRFGEKVKLWITINEAYIVALLGYGYGSFAPGIDRDPSTLQYVAAHNIIKAHAEAWHVYNDKYRAQQNGLISITINSEWAEPRNPHKQEDIDGAKRYMDFFIGWFANPIFKGDYTESMKKFIRERSLAAGLEKTRLPEFTPQEIARINGTHDFFGLNYYTAVLVFPVDFGNTLNYDADRGVAFIHDRTWLDTGSSWLKIAPLGFRRILKYIKDEYGNPPIIVTENGLSEIGPIDLNDEHRSYFYRVHINQLLKAYHLDGVDVRGYTAWSLMDNLEWAAGYSERFGFFYVNHSDANRPRIPKASVSYYTSIVNCNGFPNPDEGPHDCLNTTTNPTSEPGATTEPVLETEVNFLGMKLSVSDAEIGLQATFALLVAAVFAVISVAALFCVSKKRWKKKQ